jgi:hypothetical protein
MAGTPHFVVKSHPAVLCTKVDTAAVKTMHFSLKTAKKFPLKIGIHCVHPGYSRIPVTYSVHFFLRGK